MSIATMSAVTIEDAVLVVDELQARVTQLSGQSASRQLRRVSVLAAKLDAYRVSLVAAIDAKPGVA